MSKLFESKQLAATKGEGAEMYVAARLMLDFGLLVMLAPASFPRWDIEVMHPASGKRATIQVKYRSRYASGNEDRNIRLRSEPSYDFFVLVGDSRSNGEERPVWVLSRSQYQERLNERVDGLWYMNNPRRDAYEGAWSSISDFLGKNDGAENV